MLSVAAFGPLAAPAPAPPEAAKRAFCLDIPKEVSFQRLEQTVPADGIDWQGRVPFYPALSLHGDMAFAGALTVRRVPQPPVPRPRANHPARRSLKPTCWAPCTFSRGCPAATCANQGALPPRVPTTSE